MIRYPDGREYTPKTTKINKWTLNNGNLANRGMGLESDITLSSNFYNENNIALIYKRPTPVKVLKIDKSGKVVEGYFEAKSTTDYNGIYKGRYVDFEAKETYSTTSFPISNIRDQQLTHLEGVIKQGGIGFFIIRFKTLNETYFLDARYILEFIKTNSRKSIPIAFVKEKGILLKEGYAPRLDYIKVIEELYFQK